MKLSNEYVAGLFDGEGYCVASKSRVSYRFYIGMEMTDESIPTCLKNQFGGTITTRLRNTDYNRKRQYKWSIYSAEEIAYFLKSISKHLFIKKDRALIVLEVAESIAKKKARGKKSTWKEGKKRIDQYLLLRKLNQRGADIL